MGEMRRPIVGVERSARGGGVVGSMPLIEALLVRVRFAENGQGLTQAPGWVRSPGFGVELGKRAITLHANGIGLEKHTLCFDSLVQIFGGVASVEPSQALGAYRVRPDVLRGLEGINGSFDALRRALIEGPETVEHLDRGGHVVDALRMIQ